MGRKRVDDAALRRAARTLIRDYDVAMTIGNHLLRLAMGSHVARLRAALGPSAPPPPTPPPEDGR